jgi:hypothetical protein
MIFAVLKKVKNVFTIKMVDFVKIFFLFSLECEPFLKPANSSQKYAPCGAIANSLFNDTITLQYRKKGNHKLFFRKSRGPHKAIDTPWSGL